MKRTLALILLAGCAAAQQGDDTQTTCTGDGKCDDGTTAHDPFAPLGDLPSQSFEFIVIGSGAGGGPLAANLARQGHSVLLLEAGKEAGGKTEYQVPARHPRATETKDLAWHYYVDHYSDPARAAQDTKHTPAGILYPRGSALGGSTAVNAMITVAPANSDWDNIAAITGDDSWRADNMNPYFERVSKWLGIERPQIDSDTLFDQRLLAILTATFKVAALTGLGGPDVDESNPIGNLFVMFDFFTKDINEELQAGSAQGVYQIPLATKNHERNGTREYLLKTIHDARKFPLHIKTQALVTRVLFDDAPDADGQWHANGVEFLDGNNLYSADLGSASAAAAPQLVQIHATREVIVSAGAFNTPQLLMLSGIGERAQLEANGIDVKVDLPGVGKNLQDRYEVGVVSELSDDFTAEGKCTFAADKKDPCYREWQNAQGPYTSNGGAVSILMRSRPDLAEPDLHIFALPGLFKGYYPGYSADTNKDKHHLTWVILKAHNQNKAGTVRLRSSDPRERPAINFHYFDDGDLSAASSDLSAVVAGVDFVRRIEKRTSGVDLFASYNEVWPGTSARTDADIADWVKREAWGHHASCSDKIGADGDPDAVLDSKFHVRGTTGLRVVDASVFPDIPGTFIVVPVYMVSEKATDTILGDLGETRTEANFPQ